MSIIKNISNCGIIPVVVIEDSSKAIPLANALLKGGINVMEITLRTSEAYDAITKISKNIPEMILGAGTVLSVEQILKSVKSGAQFIVTPGIDINLVKKSKEIDIPILPGVLTPSEIMLAEKLELSILKFFPAGSFGGLNTIKTLSSPFPRINFMPTGGVNSNNLEDFLKFDKIFAVGGSWICDKELINASNWAKITQLAKEAREIYSKVRN